MKNCGYYPKTMDNNLIYNILLLLGIVVYFPLVGIIKNLFIIKYVFSSDCLDDGHVIIDWTKPNGKVS